MEREGTIASMKPMEDPLSRRERQVMDILFRLGKATAQEVLDELPDPPSYSAVRALLVTLETKGLARHAKESRRYVYSPAVPEKRAKRSALRQLLSTFFEGRPENLVASLLDPEDQQLSREEIEKIRRLIKTKGENA
jgi:predicted transcriptional regulator